MRSDRDLPSRFLFQKRWQARPFWEHKSRRNTSCEVFAVRILEAEDSVLIEMVDRCCFAALGQMR